MEFNNNKAIYYQISDLICENILLEKYKEGGRLISVREMAVNLEVNPNTVMRSYNYLQEKGIIYNKRGIGYFISENGKEIVISYKKDSFVEDDLPETFKGCSLYGIEPAQLNQLYIDYLEGAYGEAK